MLRALLSEPLWKIDALRVRMEYLDRETLDATLATLVVEGLAVRDRVDVQASRPVRYLETFGVLNLNAPNGTPDAATLDRILARHRGMTPTR
jgi:hypothetical protein